MMRLYTRNVFSRSRLACRLCALLMIAAAAMPLHAADVLAIGDFEQVDAAGKPAGWQVGSTDRIKIVQEDGNRFVRFTNDDPEKTVYIEHRLKLDPKWEALRISLRMRATIDARGKEPWYGARVTYRFEDAERKMVGTYPPMPSAQQSTDGWKRFEVIASIPPGADSIPFQPGLWGAKGVMDFDDMRVEPIDNTVAQSATLPEGEKLFWGEEPVETLSATRGRIVLNGLWHIMPAIGPALSEPKGGGWGYIRVPGNWRTGQGSALSGVLAPGQGENWRGVKWDEVQRAWYERPLKIPAGWAGRRIVLDLRRVSTDARVWVNGTEVGNVSWPTGEVDITRAVRPGEEAKVRILVVATPDEGEVLRFMDAHDVTSSKATLNTAGLIGDVLLESRPAGAYVSDVFVRPSVRNKKLTLETELQGVAGDGTIDLVARLLDGKGRVEKRFTARAAVRKTDTQTVTVSWDWPDPRLWDFLKPELYTLQLSVKGAGVEDEYPQRFGFREFWTEGRRLILNGRDFRMRPLLGPGVWQLTGGTPEFVDAHFDDLLAFGFNFAEMWPENMGQRGVAHFMDITADRADLRGFPVSGIALSMQSYIGGSGEAWNRPGMKERYESAMSAELRRFRNHPSIIMWGTSGNFFGHKKDQDPRYIGRTGWADAEPAWRKRADAGREAIALIKKHDPTRPVFTHHGAYVGDIHTVNHYLCLIPLQEREEWLSAWAKDGNLPFWSIEFGTPFNATFLRGRNGFGGSIITEPLLTEFSAVYLGPAAFASETDRYRGAIRDRHTTGQTWQSWQGNAALDNEPSMQQIQSLFIGNTWRSWRTWGITGGMLPWDSGYRRERTGQQQTVQIPPFTPGRRGPYRATYEEEARRITPAGRTLTANNSATLAWIAGGPDAFTAKNHSYRAGQTVTKQAVIINDSRSPQPYTVTWTARLGGKTIASRRAQGTAAVAKNVFVPIAFSLPAKLEASKVDGEIVLQATIGSAKHADRFAFRAFAPPPAASKTTVSVFDPAGETTRLLRALGYTVQPWNGQPVPLVVIGRKALSSGAKLPADLQAFVRSGGRVVVMAQDPQWMREYLGLRTTYHPTRYVFRVSAAHPVVAGLDDLDLRDWNSSGALIAPYPTEYVESKNGYPYAGWHWGNRGSVASVAIEKPHRAGWRPILECEFDLSYSPLMELDYGKGRLTLCTLDLEDQAAVDPAADRLARQMLRHAATAPLKPRTDRTVYIGDDTGARLLDAMGVVYTRLPLSLGGEGGQGEGASAPLAGKGTLLLVGPNPGMADTAIAAHAAAGNTVVYLPAHAAAAPGGATLAETKAFHGALSVPDWPETAGLSVSDVRWRTDAPAWLVSGGATIGAGGQIARRAEGKGTILWAQLDPTRFDSIIEQQPYLRYTRWRQMRALAQVLANAGATFAMDSRIFTPRAARADLLSLAGEWKAKLTKKMTPAPSPQQTLPDPGMTDAAKALLAADADESGMRILNAPGELESMGGEWTDADGESAVRKTIEVPAAWRGKDLLLSFGRVDDFDDTYFNGERIGGQKGWNLNREYVIPANKVLPGRNVIAIRIWDNYGSGGFTSTKDDLYIRPNEQEIAPSLYHPDYRADFELGDDPYRYYRW